LPQGEVELQINLQVTSKIWFKMKSNSSLLLEYDRLSPTGREYLKNK